MSILINLAAEFTGKKAFDKADKSVVNLEKSAKKLAKALGLGLSTAAVVAFGKASVKAFAEDEKAAVRLAGVLDNLGLAFANPQIATFIEDLSKAAGVADDDLRPAFQALIQTTGSLTNSQKLLTQAIDLSAGAGVDLTQAANDLAQAYVGNTKGLRKYNLGLTQAELKAASFADIQERLTKLFSGANAKYLETYAGKMQLLSTRAGEAKETIGAGLVDALMEISGDTTVEDLATNMDNFATYTANATRGLGKLIGKLTEARNASPEWLNKLTNLALVGVGGLGINKALDALAKSGAQKQSTGFSFFGSPMETLQKQRDAAAAAKAERDAKRREQDRLKTEKALLAEQKKQAALKKAGSIFDKEQIQLIAALKGNLSDEERKRVELQLALETENVAEAKKLTYELAIAQGLGVKLANDLASLPAASNPFAAWKGYLDEVELQAKRIASMTVTPSVPSSNGQGLDFGGNVIGTPVPNFTPPASGTYGSASNAGAVVVQIDGKTIASALLDQSLSGNQAYINRRTGGFE